MHPPAPDPAVRPKLRPGLAAERQRPDLFILHDTLGIGSAVGISPLALELAQRFDGKRSLTEIVADVVAEFPEVRVPHEAAAQIAAALDEALLLDSPRFREQFCGPIRAPRCIGCYSADPDELRTQLNALFTASGGPGTPGKPRSRELGERLRAVLVPHMDYGRGNITYGHGFKELIENTDARVFVIVATSHYSGHRFTLSRQHFDTPLGVVETDQGYVDAIESHYGPGLFDDPLAHVPEHSIELEVVLLKHLMGRRKFKIVPLLTGSLHDRVQGRADPAEAADLARMVSALRAAEAACPESVCYVISGDLAHIGPKFRDRRKATGPWLDESREKDADILKTLEAADPTAFFSGIAAEGDARRICGLPPTWLTLATVKPKLGKVLHYQQFVHPEGHESVSFAAAAFYG